MSAAAPPAAAITAALALALAGCGAEEKQQPLSADEVARQLASVEVEPGLWETRRETLEVSAPGMAVEQARGRLARVDSSRSCISSEQARNPQANFLAIRQSSNCTYRDFSMREGRVQGTTICVGGRLPGETVTAMRGRYGRQAYEMVLETTNRGALPEGAAFTIKSRIAGRRVGECPAGARPKG